MTRAHKLCYTVRERQKEAEKRRMEIKPGPMESKLLILHLLEETGVPLDDVQVLRVFVDLGLMNYFDLMNYVSELAAGEMLTQKELPAGRSLSITQKGRDVLREFDGDIRYSQKKQIREYCDSCKKEFRDQSRYTGEYSAEGSGYRVRLQIIDGDESVFGLQILVFSIDEAMRAVENWRRNAPKIYTGVFDLLS